MRGLTRGQSCTGEHRRRLAEALAGNTQVTPDAKTDSGARTWTRHRPCPTGSKRARARACRHEGLDPSAPHSGRTDPPTDPWPRGQHTLCVQLGDTQRAGCLSSPGWSHEPVQNVSEPGSRGAPWSPPRAFPSGQKIPILAPAGGGEGRQRLRSGLGGSREASAAGVTL